MFPRPVRRTTTPIYPSSSGSVRRSASDCSPRGAIRIRSRWPVPTPSPNSASAYADLEVDTKSGQIVGVAGRVVFARNSGKLCFATLQEGDGTQLQAMISLDGVGKESLDAWKADVDLGDIVFVHGEVISSRRGELVCACRFLANHLKGPAATSRRAQGAQRGVAGAAALRRSDRASGGSHHCPPTDCGRSRGAFGIRATRLSRSGNADAADPRGRCRRAAIRDALQCPRRRSVPAHRTGVVPETVLGRWFREGLRDESELSKRRRGFHAFTGIRDARDLSGLRHLRRFAPS